MSSFNRNLTNESRIALIRSVKTKVEVILNFASSQSTGYLFNKTAIRELRSIINKCDNDINALSREVEIEHPKPYVEPLENNGVINNDYSHRPEPEIQF